MADRRARGRAHAPAAMAGADHSGDAGADSVARRLAIAPSGESAISKPHFFHSKSY